MVIRNSGIAIALFALMTYAAHSQAAHRASLFSIYHSAVENNAQLSASRHAYKATREGVPQAWAGLLPNLTSGATSEVSTLSRDEPSLSRKRSGTVFQARLSQPVFRLDRWYQLQAAEATNEQAELELAAQEQELILNVARAYFETLKALDELSASEAEEAAMEKQQSQAQARLVDGVSSITDVLDAKAAFDNARANRKLSERKVDDAYEQMFRLTNIDFSSIDGIEHSMPIDLPTPYDVMAWTNQAVTHNLQLQAKTAAVAAAEHTNRQRKAGHLPTLDAVASYRKGDNDSFGYSNPTDFGRNGYRGDVAQGSIGLELNFPIYTGGSVSSQVRESSERLLQSQDDKEEVRRSIVQQTRNAFRAVVSDVEQIKARLETIKSSAESLKANRVGLDVGTRNTVDVLNAQRKLYDAVRDYNAARYDFIINTLALKYAAGSLSPNDLQQLSEYQKIGYDSRRDFLPPGVDEPAVDRSMIGP